MQVYGLGHNLREVNLFPDPTQLTLDRLQLGGHPLDDLLLNLGLLQIGRPRQTLELLQHP